MYDTLSITVTDLSWLPNLKCSQDLLYLWHGHPASPASHSNRGWSA